MRSITMKKLLPRRRRHRGAMAGRGREVLDPLFTDAVRAFDERRARSLAVLDDHDDAGVEVLLRVVDVRAPRTLGGNDVRNGDLCPVSLEDWPALRIPSGGREVPKDEEVR